MRTSQHSRQETAVAVSNLDSATLALPPFESPPVGDDGIAAALAEGRPALIVERPDMFGTRQAPRPLEVSGWAWSGAGIETVLVVIDDEIEIKALHDLFRPDLRSLFGDNLATSGFAVRIDPRDWPPGPHKLTVIAIDATGHAIGVSGAVESVAQPSAPLVAVGDFDDDQVLELWRQRAIRAEIDLAVRQTDAYWDLYVGNEAIARATARDDELRSRLLALERERDEAREACRAVQRSASWRLTAPLRRAKRLAGR
jgi:hypothetical protein